MFLRLPFCPRLSSLCIPSFFPVSCFLALLASTGSPFLFGLLLLRFRSGLRCLCSSALLNFACAPPPWVAALFSPVLLVSALGLLRFCLLALLPSLLPGSPFAPLLLLLLVALGSPGSVFLVVVGRFRRAVHSRCVWGSRYRRSLVSCGRFTSRCLLGFFLPGSSPSSGSLSSCPGTGLLSRLPRLPPAFSSSRDFRSAPGLWWSCTCRRPLGYYPWARLRRLGCSWPLRGGTACLATCMLLFVSAPPRCHLPAFSFCLPAGAFALWPLFCSAGGMGRSLCRVRCRTLFLRLARNSGASSVVVLPCFFIRTRCFDTLAQRWGLSVIFTAVFSPASAVL